MNNDENNNIQEDRMSGEYYDGQETEKEDVSGNNKVKIAGIIAGAVVIIAAIVAVAVIFSGKGGKKDKEYPTSSAASVYFTTEETSSSASTTEDQITTEKKTSQRTTTTTTTEKIIPDQLYRPGKSSFVDQYTAYVFCTDTDVQDYVKMRYGPDKSKYDVVTPVSNNEEVTVETKSVNGWTLCYYNGSEGWIRSDFIFNIKNSSKYKNVEFCSEYYIIAEGRSTINMRSEPTSDSTLITSIPCDSGISLFGTDDDRYYDDEWTLVRYKDNYGWVKSEHIALCGVGDKPVLYLYPERTTDVKVKLGLNNIRLSCTYPEYNNGWSVTAKPDGTLINKADNSEYSYLYWEFEGNVRYDFSKGFVVKGSDTASFLREVLPKMGLLPREYNEFIVYWLPRMQNNKYNLISFQTKAYTDACKLSITPEPDSLLRVFMAYKPIDKYIEIEPQTFAKFERKGFTAVEWGGTELK